VLGFERVSKQLICAHCDAVVAAAAYRPLLSWRLDITSPEGYQVTPLAGSVQLRIAQQELASASPAEQPQARWRAGFIGRHLSEVIYDLPCPRGHRTLVTEPQIARAVRKAKGSWVTLKEASP
jgi:hypothetical protein